MKVLVVGSGGREHTLVWKLAQSPQIGKLFCAPGNAGISESAECVDIGAESIPELADFAERRKIDLTVVGPERPLIAGIVDEFEKRGLRCFGPRSEAAILEGSKAFTDELLAKYGIPSADFEAFDDPDQAKAYVRDKGAPIVIKADGDAAGKGVVVAQTVEQAEQAIHETMVDRIHGEAGKRLVVEECLVGQECSIKVFSDGEDIVPMVPSQDYKRAFDDDQGPNTGGMGCYSPVPAVDEALFDQILERLIRPTIQAMAAEGRPYRGVLYGGLMLTEEGPKLLEYNCRFGDPETQVVLPRLESDLLDLLLATVEGRLAEATARWRTDACVCVVLASGGYPGSYEKGRPIHGLERAAQMEDVVVFHAGTAREDGQLVTAGGRVLGVTALGDGFESAVGRVYQAVGEIEFEDVHYRRDIARRALG
ncbi:MAG: phosphoribosylamine--glycine ligase [Armatimonadota bacterium]